MFGKESKVSISTGNLAKMLDISSILPRLCVARTIFKISSKKGSQKYPFFYL